MKRRSTLYRKNVLRDPITVLLSDGVDGKICMRNRWAVESMIQPNATGKEDRDYDEAYAIFQTTRNLTGIVNVVQEVDMVSREFFRAPRADFQVELKPQGKLRKFLIGSVFRVFSSNGKRVVDAEFVRRLLKKKLNAIKNCIGYLKIFQDSDDWFLYRRVLYIEIPTLHIYNLFCEVFYTMINDFMNVPYMSTIVHILPNSTGIFTTY